MKKTILAITILAIELRSARHPSRHVWHHHFRKVGRLRNEKRREERINGSSLPAIHGPHGHRGVSDPPAEAENKAILPANTPIEFTLDKNKMNFKVNGKKYQYIVVGTSALDPNTK